MAEGALRVLLERERPGETRVMSAGTGTADGYPATEFAVEAARMWKADISGHSSQLLTPELIAESDLILTMTQHHRDRVLQLDPAAADRTFLLKQFPDDSPVGEPVDDPIGQPLTIYNQVFLEIGEYLGKNLSEFLYRIDERKT